jgi:hypothetical protein
MTKWIRKWLFRKTLFKKKRANGFLEKSQQK